jgi:hypothetical protein
MRNLIFVFAMLFSVLAFSQETQKTGLYYCVQVVSTENPQLLQPLMFMAMDDRAMVEKAVVNGREYYRVIFIYETIEEQDGALHNWRHQWKDAIRVTRNEDQLKKMFPLFTELK